MSEPWMPPQPFGVSVETNRELGARSHDQGRGAERLLVKAGRATVDGDAAKAGRFVERVARMPYDRHQEYWPGPQAGHMLIFEMLTHVVETTASDDSDPLDGLGDWMEAVEASAGALAGGDREALLDALAPVRQDGGLVRAVDRRLALVIGDSAGDSDRRDERWMDPELPYDDVLAGTSAAVVALLRLSGELEARGLCSHLEPDYWQGAEC